MKYLKIYDLAPQILPQFLTYFPHMHFHLHLILFFGTKMNAAGSDAIQNFSVSVYKIQRMER